MTVYITKHALTSGIQEARDAQICRTVSESMIQVPSLGWNAYFHGEGKQWHRTREGAVAKAKEMQAAKIRSLEKSLKKIKTMRFD